MKKNNDLGNYISNKLQNINQVPNDEIWDMIEEKLEKKKKKRFYFYSIFGLLTCLTIGYFLLTINFNQKTYKPTIQKTSNKENITSIENNLDSIKSVKHSKGKISNNKKNSIDSINIIEKIKTSKSILSETEDYIIYKETIIYKTLKHKRTSVNTQTISINSDRRNTNNENTSTTKKNNSRKTNGHSIKENHSNLNTIKNTQNQNKEITNIKNEINKTEQINSSKSETTNLLVKEDNLYKNFKASIIELNETTDTIITTAIKKRKLEEKNKDKPKENIEKNKKDQHYISVYFGPTLYTSLTKGSSVNSSLISNKKTISLNSSYGIYYRKMYKNIGFRIGISNTNLSYNTIIPNNNNQFLTDYYNIQLNSNLTKESINATFNGSNEVKLRQNLSYYELPLEIYKTLLKGKSKIGLDLFLGLTPQYLNKNSLTLESSNIKNYTIGKSINLRDVNIGFQVGLGINYSLSKKLQLDVNPIFKYQTFPHEEHDNFNPIYIAIQSGLSYKF
ncbi:hypothetical protein SY27_04140 [Flavobacterium sp. 316]|uniref:hypothetical protein n=1 Tax=Flavobacterium sp. 316 TaxID=1603293 RepID=UPI0005E049DF|nr:hypothetical protein [Flavobacterium sp. 316]KIX21881.1 hypothetical protein SY27_04140 [Flavobacterium sp. 316]